MSAPEAWLCPHGAALTVRGECSGCNDDLDQRPAPEAMSGDERAEEVRSLMEEPNAYIFSEVHRRMESLVGRSVWTHEMARSEHLIAEARTWKHPADLEAHVIGSLDQIAGTKPVLIVRPDPA